MDNVLVHMDISRIGEATMTPDELRAEIDRLTREGEQMLRDIKSRYEGTIDYLRGKLKEAENVEETADSD